MKIKELEELLSVSRSNIRFYEKAGLLKPKREENNYRNYSDEDVAQLKKILCLRKLGFQVEEIAMLQRREATMGETARKNIARLEAELENLQEALVLTKSLAKEGLEYEQMDADHLWDSITAAEEKGGKFMEIWTDLLDLELLLLDHNHFFFGFRDLRKKRGIAAALEIFLLLLVIRGVSSWLLWGGSFWEGFLYPLQILAMATIVILPIWLLRKKAPQVAGVLADGLLFLCIAFLGGLLLLFVIILLRNMF